MSTSKEKIANDESRNSWRTGLYEFFVRVRWVNIIVVGMGFTSAILIFLGEVDASIYILCLANTLALITLLSKDDNNGVW